MRIRPRQLRARLTAAALCAAAAATAAGLAAGPPATAAGHSLCGLDSTSVASGLYRVQNNEWGSSAKECSTTTGTTGFRVTESAISKATNGAPGGYPSIYKGCHWGRCTANSHLPIKVSAMTAGKVVTSWSTVQPASGVYDVAYDVWFDKSATTDHQPNGAELMVWLSYRGAIRPVGTKVATATINGARYDVWFGNQGWNTISYVRTTHTTAVHDLGLASLTQDAARRTDARFGHYISQSWYLISVEAGFELWQGGAGLATQSFSVAVR